MLKAICFGVILAFFAGIIKKVESHALENSLLTLKKRRPRNFFSFWPPVAIVIAIPLVIASLGLSVFLLVPLGAILTIRRKLPC